MRRSGRDNAVIFSGSGQIKRRYLTVKIVKRSRYYHPLDIGYT